MVAFWLLGPVRFQLDGRPVDLGPARQRAVLAALLVDADRVVGWDTLLDRVWGDEPPRTARATVHAHIAKLRPLLAPGGVELVSGGGGYRLAIDPLAVDLHRHRDLVRRATEPGADRGLLLEEAIGLWTGIPLTGISGGWADRMRTAWAGERIDLVLAWARARVEAGAPADTLVHLRSLLDDHPLVEPLAEVLMRALAALGRTAEALELYARTRATLADELGSDPGRPLQDLHRELLRGSPVAAGSAAGAGPPPATLPGAVTDFIGRVQALAVLDAVLDDRRADRAVVISAVSGTAGVGKTALALHWAHRVADRFPDGQLYVNLRGFDEARQYVDPQVALRGFLEALGVPPERIPQSLDGCVARYRSLLAGRRVLVLLDNARDAEQVRPLLPGAPGCVVVVTSRNQLTPLVAVEGAQPVRLDVFSESEAEALLTRRLGPRAAADPAARKAVIAACAGLPLALAIVAARARQTGFPLRELAEELSDADRRWGALDGGEASVQVEAVFSWSYEALSAGAARLFRLLGLHRGPDLSTAAAASLAGRPRGETVRLLAELTRASLLVEHRPGRFTFHDLLRAYAARTAEAEEPGAQRSAAIVRMLEHYRHTAYAAEYRLSTFRGPPPLPLGPVPDGVLPEPVRDYREAAEWFGTERTVLVNAVLGDTPGVGDEQVAGLAWAMENFLYKYGHWRDHEAVRLAGLAAAERFGSPIAVADALGCVARLALFFKRFDEARALYERTTELYAELGNTMRLGHTLIQYANFWHRMGDSARALEQAQRALTYLGPLGERHEAEGLNAVGWAFAKLGNHEQALAHCEPALAVVRRLGIDDYELTMTDSVGYCHYLAGRYEVALEYYGRALAMMRAAGHVYVQAETLANTGDAHCAKGDPEQAGRAWRESLRLYTQLDQPEAATIRAKLDALGGRIESAPVSDAATAPAPVSSRRD